MHALVGLMELGCPMSSFSQVAPESALNFFPFTVNSATLFRLYTTFFGGFVLLLMLRERCGRLAT
ncbi:hypothetical protein GALMADRAFT_250370, partial [Galerina marginata CBS 339.88]